MTMYFFFVVVDFFPPLALDSNVELWLFLHVPVVAAAVIQARSGAARGFAASLYDRPNGMELAIFNDLCFC